VVTDIEDAHPLWYVIPSALVDCSLVHAAATLGRSRCLSSMIARFEKLLAIGSRERSPDRLDTVTVE
jgi:hypothetical protein